MRLLQGPVDISLNAPPDGQLYAPAHAFNRIPIVQKGVVLPDWAASRPDISPATISGSGTDHLSFGVSLALPGAATMALGQPSVFVDDPSVFHFKLQKPPTDLVPLKAEPQNIDLTIECLKPGMSRVHLSIPLHGYCTLGVVFNHKCNDGAGSSPNGLLWLLTLLGIPLCCCCYCLTPQARVAWAKRFTGQRLNEEDHAAIFPVSESGEKRLSGISRASMRYRMYELWSRIRTVIEEVRSHNLRLDQVPRRLTGSSRHGMRSLPDEDEQELL